MASQTATAAEPFDPYALDPANVMEPPRTLRKRFRYLGPGLILSAAVVGSGELITTTALGSQAGFVLLWLVVVSTAVKVWVQVELATWSILTGQTAVQGFAQVKPRTRRGSWVTLLWIVMDFAKILQRGGIIGGVAACLSIMFPVMGEPLEFPSLAFWTGIALVATVALLITSKYGVIERLAFVSVVLFTLITVALALGLPVTPFSYSADDVLGGLSFALPVAAIGFAVAMFGLTGVGADEMTTYTFWVLEKGYGRWTGPDDGTEERAVRAEGWIKVMRLDALVSWLTCTLCTLSFYVIGAAVLHPQGLVPEGNEMISTLSRMYTDLLGSWAQWVFLIGAFFVLWSTFVASTASVPRLWTNTLGVLGVFDWSNVRVRERIIRVLTICYPVIWAASFLIVQSPVLMVMIGGIASGLFLIAVVIAVWVLRRQVDRRYRRSPVWTVMLTVSSVAIGLLGTYTVATIFGFTIG
ncbi:Nramp family divalent metal transporter [Glycomyces sp. TRM65418]|uniref:Nramp family divalent metal transporter n=1 Tax=Glycomyces sp. TRM65418 TaxID=2867006 RepID=UPI001CE5D795|nr:Nramp family divalent metal transporter [Glycomyces sp. TRM65418]MCC3764473.1 Nramp family divalent metal transporter [Glycomyces sp. TRM65418]QZD54146.1 Nramp family divalent metal transporter [Glycomyces sp. TRM65418]